MLVSLKNEVLIMSCKAKTLKLQDGDYEYLRSLIRQRTIQAQVVNLLRDYQQEKGLAYLFIAHDLSMVRYVSDVVGVMYLGQLVELCDAEEVYSHPLHPYTKGLLASIPIADPKLARQKQTSGIEGDLPSPVNPPSGCRFRTRCPYAKPICAEVPPCMKEVSPGHKLACHLYD